MAFGAPAQHAAGEIGDIAKPSLAQDHGGLCRAAAGAADRDDRAVARELAGAIGQLGEWNELGTANMPERPLELPRFANIEDLNLAGMLFEAVRIDLPDAGKGVFEMGPARVFARNRVGFGPAAFEVCRNRDIHLLWVGQPQVLHVAGEIAFAGLAAEARVEAALLADAGNRQPAII